MGCNSSAPKKPTQSPPTLAEDTAEGRALTQLKLVFDSIDASKDGIVSKDELTKALEKDDSLGALIKEAGLNVKYNVLSGLSTNKDGFLSWDEFLGHLKEKAVEEVEAKGELAAAERPAAERALEQLKAVFESIDADGNGAVDKDELKAKLQKDTDEHGLQKDGSFGQLIEEAGFNPNFFLLDKLDTNQDGRITWDEFEKNLKLVEVAVKEVKETGELAAASELPATEKVLNQLKSAFQSIAADVDGAVDKAELKAKLGFEENTDASSLKDSFEQWVADAGFNPNFRAFDQLATKKYDRITWDEFEKNLKASVVAATDAVVQEVDESSPVCCGWPQN